jgi:hypothetical protein
MDPVPAAPAPDPDLGCACGHYAREHAPAVPGAGACRARALDPEEVRWIPRRAPRCPCLRFTEDRTWTAFQLSLTLPGV